MAWADKPTVVSRHAISQYKKRVMLARCEAMTDEQIKCRLANMVRLDRLNRILPSGAIEFSEDGISIVVLDLTRVRKVVTTKVKDMSGMQSLQRQFRSVQKTLSRRMERWLG